ncbi:MAG: hypothetical protein QOF68_2832 [Gaiellales bacterium]|jgi:hypothetical protein|nr:hypothetical protein [Gaiellales bacterium]
MAETAGSGARRRSTRPIPCRRAGKAETDMRALFAIYVALIVAGIAAAVVIGATA